MSVAVEYSYVYAYRKGQGAWNLPAPIVTVRLYHQSQSLRISGLLDTGASISIFDSEIAQSLGIDNSRLQMVPTVGLGGMQAARLFPRMRLKLGPLDTPIECRVLFMDGPISSVAWMYSNICKLALMKHPKYLHGDQFQERSNMNFPIIDGHNDALMDYAPVGKHTPASFMQRHPQRQMDLPSLQAGNVHGGFFAVFIPDESSMSMVHSFSPDEEYVLPALDLAYAQRMTQAMAANLFRIEAASQGKFKVIRTADEMAACMQGDTVGAVLHFEGAEAIDPDFHALEVYYQAGLRSLGLVWSRPTLYAEGVPFKFPHSPDTGPGLTDAGCALVKACNQLGILIDLSHLNEKGFWDVARITDAPLVATHSNAHALCQLPRNLIDKQLDAIKESGGIVGVNFVVMLVRSDAANDANTPLSDVVGHIHYLVERMGIDHVGFGSDFGAATVPAELSDAGKFPVLIEALRQAGYDDDALNKLTHQNWLRVLRQTWKASA